MAHPPHRPIDRGSRIQLVAVLLVVLVVAVVGILVVAYPRQLGLPGLQASPMAGMDMEATPGR